MRSHLPKGTRAYTKAGFWDFRVQAVGREGSEGDYIFSSQEEQEGGFKSVWLGLTRGTNKPFWIHLSSFTGEELEAFERLVSIAIEDAKQVASALDGNAQAAFEANDEEVPARALAMAPPWFEREVDLSDAPPQETL